VGNLFHPVSIEKLACLVNLLEEKGGVRVALCGGILRKSWV